MPAFQVSSTNSNTMSVRASHPLPRRSVLGGVNMNFIQDTPQPQLRPKKGYRIPVLKPTTITRRGGSDNVSTPINMNTNTNMDIPNTVSPEDHAMMVCSDEIRPTFGTHVSHYPKPRATAAAAAEPVKCPPPKKKSYIHDLSGNSSMHYYSDEEEIAMQKEDERRYEVATWCMYHRIMKARAERPTLSCPRSAAVPYNCSMMVSNVGDVGHKRTDVSGHRAASVRVNWDDNFVDDFDAGVFQMELDD